MEKYHIEKNSVQETLVIPLYGRKFCTQRFPDLFQDPKAAALMDRLDYDFSEAERKTGSLIYRFGALEVAMREYDLMAEAREYLEAHPKASLVNLGCGLDQTAENCDNGQCRIYNIDLPDVMAARDALLPETDRIKNLAWDLNDISWFDQIESSHGVCFLAAGVFYYFKRAEVQALFPAMAERFPGGKLVFDIANARAVKMMLKTLVKDAGVTSISDYFSVESVERDLQPWMPKATITARGYLLGYHDLRVPSVPGLFRLLAKIGDGFMKMRIVRMDFAG